MEFRTFLIILYGLLFVLISDGSSSIDDYQTPEDCTASYVLNQTGVALKCQLPVINNQVNHVNFSVIPSEYTLSLDIFCTSILDVFHFESTFDDVSFNHLNVLQELTFLNCDFRVLPSFPTFPDTLTHLIFQRIYQDNGLEFAPSLEIKSGAFRELTRLIFLEITAFNLVSLPRNELCHSPHLLGLNLSSNLLQDVQILGFSSSSSHLCGDQLKILDISFNQLQSLEDESFIKLYNLQLLFLQGNSINRISSHTFTNMSSLLLLDLSRNKINQLPVRIWHDNDQLIFLNVSHNQLSGAIDESTFENLEKLMSLDLSDNMINIISMNTFDNLTNLAELFLSTNQICTIADGTFKSLINLDTLDLSDNRIVNLTSTSLFGLDNLVTLFLRNNMVLRDINSNTFTWCPHVANLTLGNNSLMVVPKLNNLKDLQILDLAHNDIVKIDKDDFAGLSKLIGISLARNEIEEIHDEAFRDNVQLLILNLSRNKLQTYPNNLLMKNVQLLYLDLSGNQLTHTVDLQMNINLNHLNLSANYITKLHYGLLPKGISVLDASHNRINWVEDKFDIAKNMEITSLDVSYNQLEYISNALLPKTLRTLMLNNNKVSLVENRAFDNMFNLIYVDLTFNKIATLPRYSLQVAITPTLSRPRFFLQGNFFDCDCTMKWLKTINEENHRASLLRLNGLVYDLPFLFCWIQNYGDMVGTSNNNRALSLLTTTPDEMFLCSFDNHTFTEPFCNHKIINLTICEIVCPPTDCQCHRDDNWNIVVVVCRRANITRIPPNIPILVTTLYLDGNAIKQLSVVNESFGRLSQLPSLKRLYLNDTGLEALTPNVFAGTMELEELYLQRNKLITIENETFDQLSSLWYLDLSSNLLFSLDAEVFHILKSLKVLLLNDNKLTSFEVWRLTTAIPTISKLSLSENPWSCDCDYLENYRNWLQNFAQVVTDPEKLFCQPDNNETELFPIIAFNASLCFNATSINNEQLMENNYHITLAISLICTLMTISLLSILFYAYRREMQVLIYSRYGVRLFHRSTDADDEEDGVQKNYDAFVSYSSLDEDFVVHELLPKLEGCNSDQQPMYKLCLHHRNFMAGAFIIDSIIEAVEKSRRTILLISDNFISSEWCRFEFKSAHLQMLKDRRNRVILIILGKIPDNLDPEMKLYMKTNTYLQWGDRLFWQKLYFAMPEIQKSIST